MQHSISTFFFLLFSKKKLVTCVTHPDLLRISTVHINAFCFTVRSYCKILESIEINGTLCKIPKFHLNFPGVGNFVETHSFCRISGELPKTMWKLCFSTKFMHQEISWNFDIFRSVRSNFLIYFNIFQYYCKTRIPLE